MHDEDDAQTERYGVQHPPSTAIKKGRDYPYLIVLSGGPVGTMYKLPSDTVTVIGRGPEAQVQLPDNTVSRQHARITVRNGDPVLEDLGSSNGTFVNGERVHERALKDGDKIEIGHVSILKFSYQDELDLTFHKELFDRGIKDDLTGIYNRRYFLDRFDAEFVHAQRHKQKLSLLIFDIDHFKAVNDTHGHPFGDFVLKEIARILVPQLRKDDLFVRFGGEEFVVLSRDLDDAGTLVLAQRIRRLIKGYKFKSGNAAAEITISIGMASLGEGMRDPSALIQLADDYLYKAKRAGRDRIGGRGLKGAA